MAGFIIPGVPGRQHAPGQGDWLMDEDDMAIINGMTAITQSDSSTFSPGGKGTLFFVSVTGNIKVGFPDGSTLIWNIPLVGEYKRDWNINQVFIANTTATFTAYTLH